MAVLAIFQMAHTSMLPLPIYLYFKINLTNDIEWTEKNMLTPLQYQVSEYDCVPTALINAVSFLFQDESKTLKDKDIDGIMDKLMQNYEKRFV